jgi:cytochrome P450
MTSIADYEQLLPQFDVFEPAHSRQKWDMLAYARAKCPVPHTDADGGYHLVTRYEDVRQVLEDPETYSSSIPSVKPAPVRIPPLDADPPLHPEFRRILNPFMSRSYVLRFEQDMRTIAGDAIDSWIDDGRCEFIDGFAVPYSSGILARVVFDETDPARVAEGVSIINRIAHDQSPEAIFDMAMLCAGYLEKRESSGEQRDDLLGTLLTSTIDGRPLTDEERLGVVIVLFFGGLDTTRAAIGNIMANLVADPSLEQRLRSPSWIRQDMDEFLRYESPVTFMARVVTKDTVLGDVSLAPGDRVLVHFASANRDAAKFEDPDHLRLDLHRGGHAGFGLGIHRCVGSNLARVQLELAWDELLKRLTSFRLEPGAEIEYATGQVHGPERLPITFERLA